MADVHPDSERTTGSAKDTNDYRFRENHWKNGAPMFVWFMVQHSSDRTDRANARVMG